MKFKPKNIAIVKTCFGGALLLLALLFALLGKDQYFGYLDNNVIFVVAVSVIVGLYGTYNFIAYFKYLENEVNGKGWHYGDISNSGSKSGSPKGKIKSKCH